MKQMEVTTKQIGENIFYIKPFPAFTAANISGELAAVITPMLSGLAPIFGEIGDTKTSDSAGGASAEPANIMDMEIETALPAISDAFSAISGDKIERLMKKLLIDSKNVSVEGEATGGKAMVMTMDLANEVFCGDLQDMYILCFEVIRINFGGFFRRLGIQSGSLKAMLQKKIPSTESGAN